MRGHTLTLHHHVITPFTYTIHTHTHTHTHSHTHLTGHLSDGKDATNAAVLAGFLALHMLPTSCYQGAVLRQIKLEVSVCFASMDPIQFSSEMITMIVEYFVLGCQKQSRLCIRPPSNALLGTCSIWGASATHGVVGGSLNADEVTAGRALGARVTMLAKGTRSLRLMNMSV